ncbi:MAG: hypothetical protein QXV39_07210 [Candidatus Caldarchaeum sp.]|uniref:Uncharacterized protein n=1 Tax=Caldiarchaeum subterraneum TaxID=311458 RepID=A0A7C4HYY9_CALS0
MMRLPLSVYMRGVVCGCMLVYRQGDVLLRRIHPFHVPRNGERVAEVAVKGETGNVHRLVGRYEAYSANGQVYVLVKEESVLEHPEHMPLTIPPGAYVLSRVREFDREDFIKNLDRYLGRPVSD